MAVRRLAETQPESFAFSPENHAWAEREIAKFPEGRQASAVIALLWRAQEQEGWITKPAIEQVAEMLSMPTIRVLEVATFYTMFHLEPVGTKAHVQVCGTTPCMLRGAGDIIDVCRRRIHAEPHHRSADEAFSWEEVECLGACVNAPMVQVFKDTYEDLTPESFEAVLDAFDRGETPTPGPQNGRHHSVPINGLTSLTEIDYSDGAAAPVTEPMSAPAPARSEPAPAEPSVAEAPRATEGPTQSDATAVAEAEPELLTAAPDEGADDLKRISGVGPKLEGLLNSMGIYTFAQVAAWTPENIAWVDDRLKFKGRIDRDDWLGQARKFAAEKSGR